LFSKAIVRCLCADTLTLHWSLCSVRSRCVTVETVSRDAQVNLNQLSVVMQLYYISGCARRTCAWALSVFVNVEAAFSHTGCTRLLLTITYSARQLDVSLVDQTYMCPDLTCKTSYLPRCVNRHRDDDGFGEPGFTY
jgi:hypothetical protein